MAFITTIFIFFISVLGGILLAALSKKKEGVVYGTLDKVGFVTNIILIPAYAFALPLPTILAFMSEPGTDEGILFVIGLIACFVVALAPAFCGFGLGLSVMLRKRGKSVLSFIVQFAGVFGILLSVLVYAFSGSDIIAPLN